MTNQEKIAEHARRILYDRLHRIMSFQQAADIASAIVILIEAKIIEAKSK